MKIEPYIKYESGEIIYRALFASEYAYGRSHSQAIANLLGILALK